MFYLKCDDPGPKGQEYWDFEYEPIDAQKLKQEIECYEKKYKNITFYSKLLDTNEIEDSKLIGQVKDRTKYVEFLNDDKKLLRALHFNYNIEQCGKIIEEIQLENNIEFDYFIFIRPDLCFTKPCSNIHSYNANKITCSNYPPFGNRYIEKVMNDHISIIPKKYMHDFFYSKMHLIKNNITYEFKSGEEIYTHCIRDKYEIKQIGDFSILRAMRF